MKIPLDGTPPTELATGADLVAIDATDVYFAGQFGEPSRVALDGGPVTPLVTDGVGVTALALGPDDVYFARRGGQGSVGTIHSVPKQGGPMATLASELALPSSVSVDATDLFFTTYSGGTVEKLSLDGGARVALFSGGLNLQVSALDDENVYFAGALGSLSRVSKDGGEPTEIAYDTHFFDIALDDASVFWVNGEALRRVPK